MKKNWKALIGVAALALCAGTAQAQFITGGIGVTDGLTGLPSGSSATVVSALTTINHNGNGAAQGCSGTFATVAGTCTSPSTFNASMTDWTFGPPFASPGTNIIVVNGFTFTIFSSGTVTPSPLVCGTPTSCNDALTVTNLVGIVTHAGFLPTAFTGSLALSGSCTSNNGTSCSGFQTGTYAYSLTALGSSTVPEPGTLALLGLGLAGVALARRRKLS